MAPPRMTNRFRRQLVNRKASQKVTIVAPGTSGTSLSVISHVAQIALAGVAIFGYFYTVLPVYQKERLAEQVAEYEGIIRKQTPKIVEAERRLDELARERSRLTQNQKIIEGELSIARAQKDKIEKQIRYMTPRYRLPDGTPATTQHQVKTVLDLEFRRTFFSSIFISCRFTSDRKVFPTYLNLKDRKSKHWPFTEEEIRVWKEYGSKYPLKIAIDCIDSTAASLRNSNDSSTASDIEKLRKEAIRYANSAALRSWSPPLEPADLLQELSAKRSTIESDMNTQLRKTQDQYGDWASVVGVYRRTHVKNNYDVGKENARIQALGNRLDLEYQIATRANLLRESINQEVMRLIKRDKE